MKILIVSQYFYPETFRVNTLAAELVKRGHKVTVLTGYPQYPLGEIYKGYGFDIPYEKEWNGVRIERVKMRPRGHSALSMLRHCLSFVYQGNKWVRKCKVKYDAVYVFEVSPVTVGLPALKYKKKFGTPVFFNVQDLWPENVEEVLGIHNKLIIGGINKIVDRIYRESDMILCSSRGFVKNIANRGVPKEKLAFWPQFCLAPQLQNTVPPPCYDKDCFNIVFTGNLGDAQGLDLLVETARKLKGKKIRWFLVGDGRARERLEGLVKSYGLEQNVIFVGKVSEQEANLYVHYADCAYLSFKNCKLFDLTIPAKLQTYLACGVPILGAVGGESAEIINEANCGLVSDREVLPLAKAVDELYNTPKEKLLFFRENAKQCYHTMFSMDDIITRLENYMENFK